MAIARHYVAEKNSGGHLPGVPLRDLTQEEFDKLPAWLQATVDASPLYRKTPAREAIKPASKDKE